MATLPWHKYTPWLPCHLLLDTSYAMVWQEEMGAPSIYRCTWVLWCCHVATFPLFFIKIFSSLSNYAKYLILENSYLAMKHENSTLLLFPNYSRTFSSMHYYFQHLYNSASMKDYVRLICGACTHWRQLEDMFHELVCVDFFYVRYYINTL